MFWDLLTIQRASPLKSKQISKVAHPCKANPLLYQVINSHCLLKFPLCLAVVGHKVECSRRANSMDTACASLTAETGMPGLKGAEVLTWAKYTSKEARVIFPEEAKTRVLILQEWTCFLVRGQKLAVLHGGIEGWHVSKWQWGNLSLNWRRFWQLGPHHPTPTHNTKAHCQHGLCEPLLWRIQSKGGQLCWGVFLVVPLASRAGPF